MFWEPKDLASGIGKDIEAQILLCVARDESVEAEDRVVEGYLLPCELDVVQFEF
jgi:hypothetical protein